MWLVFLTKSTRQQKFGEVKSKTKSGDSFILSVADFFIIYVTVIWGCVVWFCPAAFDLTHPQIHQKRRMLSNMHPTKTWS